MTASCRFNTVYLISSVKPGELNVASRLEESSLSEAAIRNSELSILKKNVASKVELLQELDEIASKCPAALPLLHLDLHGSFDFFECANGDRVSWLEIGDQLRKINTACGLNLLVVVSACYGGYAALATQLMAPSPFFGLCGPLEEVSAGDLLDNYERFYRRIFQTKDFDLALEALNEHSSVPYHGVPTRYLFKLGWSHYVGTLCSGAALKERIANVVEKALASGFPKSNLSQLRKRARQFIGNPQASFEQARDIFFMYDEHPNNRLRFPFAYEDLDHE